jgi:hypothetical protein
MLGLEPDFFMYLVKPEAEPDEPDFLNTFFKPSKTQAQSIKPKPDPSPHYSGPTQPY